MDYPPSPNQATSDVSSKNMVENQPDPSEPEPRTGPQTDQDYGCRYCDKKFSNKQALGGHQNAHKSQRASEKTGRELIQKLRFGPFGYGSGSGPTGPSLGPYYQNPDLVDRSAFHFPYSVRHPHPRHPGIANIGTGTRPEMLTPGYHYGPGRGSGGFDSFRPGWARQGPVNLPRFPGRGSDYGQNQSPNVWFSDVGLGNSVYSRPVINELSSFGPRMRPGGDVGGGESRVGINSPGNNPEPEDDLGLDLSLKL